MKYCVYIIYSKKLDRFYVGETEDLKKRLQEHIEGFYTSSYTSKTQDWVLFFKIDCQSKSQALKIEKHIKQMKSKTYCYNLKKYPEISQKLKGKYT